MMYWLKQKFKNSYSLFFVSITAIILAFPLQHYTNIFGRLGIFIFFLGFSGLLIPFLVVFGGLTFYLLRTWRKATQEATKDRKVFEEKVATAEAQLSDEKKH